jgi:hypothetical protein
MREVSKQSPSIGSLFVNKLFARAGLVSGVDKADLSNNETDMLRGDGL